MHKKQDKKELGAVTGLAGAQTLKNSIQKSKIGNCIGGFLYPMIGGWAPTGLARDHRKNEPSPYGVATGVVADTEKIKNK